MQLQMKDFGKTQHQTSPDTARDAAANARCIQTPMADILCQIC